ncbi:MAG: SMI1/KNR4 family protein [Actinomycetes bacterium]
MDEIATLLARMRELEPEVYIYGPAAEDTIRQLEAACGRPMPPSYRAFLARFGGVSILDTTYSGIIDGKVEEGRGWAWTDTKYARERCQLPEHYLVVQPDEDGFKCLDFSRAGPGGEHPVIYHMPFRVTPFHELNPSYGAWLTEDLQAMVDAWAEDA